MELSAKEIAEYTGGEVIGDENVKVSSIAKIESGKPGALCFLANPKYEHYLYTCKASIILINKSFELKQDIAPTIIRVDNAYESLASLLDLMNSIKSVHRRKRAWSARIAFSAKLGKRVNVGSNVCICKKAVIGDNVVIYPMVYIGEGVTIGDNTILYPGVKIYKGCKIGKNCIIHANTVIGSDGFGFAPTADGSYKKVPQTGIVTIEDDVEIGANSTVDRATIGTTLIEKGVKIDNLVQIAHNVVIGTNTVIAAQTGVAGSTKVGKSCVFAGQVGVAGHLVVPDKTTLAAQTGLISNIKEEGKVYMGYPAIEYRNYIKSYAIFKKNGSPK